ncbi:MAG: maleylpyruvate isomerase family mycothiol-dependent enzyme, partial [Actinomycetota bacterium]|nr:maleylpyruvate isomerase family mycothiol-dependent enzyme [Actinomycetota bacterium]
RTVAELPYIDLLHEEGLTLAAAARRDMRAAVPSCPEWTVFDLVEHIGYVHRHVAERLRRKTIEKGEPLEVVDAPSDELGVIEWYESGLGALGDLLTATASDAPAWTWWPPDNTAGFWRRRMAQETAVHRWDAENATGTASAIHPELAVDGVDEFLDIHVPAAEAPYVGPSGMVHIHRTDGDGEWLLTVTNGQMPSVRRGHQKGDAAIRGNASDVLLLMWRRMRPDDLEILGDRGLVAALWGYWEAAGS